MKNLHFEGAFVFHVSLVVVPLVDPSICRLYADLAEFAHPRCAFRLSGPPVFLIAQRLELFPRGLQIQQLIVGSNCNWYL